MPPGVVTPGRKPISRTLRPRIGDRGDQLVVGPAVEEDAESVQEGPEAGEAETAGEAHHVLLGHAEREELVRMAIAEAVDLARRGQVGREAENLRVGERVFLEGARVGTRDHFNHGAASMCVIDGRDAEFARRWRGSSRARSSSVLKRT